MPGYSINSATKLRACHSDLYKLFWRVIETFDHTVIEGRRGREKQEEYFAEGKSRVRWPNGKHNGYPSEAVDAAPYLNGEISWDPRHCLHFAGFVLGIAEEMRRRGEISHRIRWGGDWDMDNEAVTDQGFQDLVHFEIKSA